MLNNFVALIPARGGSKGLLNKNIIQLGGKPLLAWSVEAALKSKHISKVVVSSDSDAILDVAKLYGAECIKRPDYLAQDNTRTEPVISHTINYLKELGVSFEYIVLLQPTSPLRTYVDVDNAIQMIQETKADALISVVKMDKNPLKAFKTNSDGYLQGLVNNEYPFMARQDLPKVVIPNGAIYIIKAEVFANTGRLFSEKTIPYFMSELKSIDIDSSSDLKRAEKIMKFLK